MIQNIYGLDMSRLFRISIFCPDKVGLISSVTAKLFDLGANLGDTSFAVLGTGAEYTAVCSVPESLDEAEIENQLQILPELSSAEIRVAPFRLQTVHSSSATMTHHILVQGGDNPGLVARLTEVFVEFGANIVRLNTDVIPSNPGDQYRIDIKAHIPDKSVQACLAVIENTASMLQMSCFIESLKATEH